MKLGLVIGQVIATRKDQRLVGCKLLITQPIRPDGTAVSDPVVAIDLLGAGEGDRVLYASGSVASRVPRDPSAPVDVAIVGIVDSVDYASNIK
ncbi:EutN/CcmL family microcompartment protein [Brenneria izadpanahii]|uniref:EutN/CcmL family microcompartment protein n=1 Tax=Brenneria izadpanahii TaxID=2722756 RepID=A0ABX7UVI5_9GAMM|nr:EutN/CcmL family microcompartment protein [Brenneria izadpanahii]QTF08597.1 EutN/CcmL family microcompartment protein [Brenneria izadpanahii]